MASKLQQLIVAGPVAFLLFPTTTKLLLKPVQGELNSILGKGRVSKY